MCVLKYLARIVSKFDLFSRIAAILWYLLLKVLIYYLLIDFCLLPFLDVPKTMIVFTI